MYDKKAFGGDTYLGKEFEKLVKKHKIQAIVETGTFHGHTTKEFAKMVPMVYTLEYKQEFADIARKNLKGVKNVKILVGSSPDTMRELLPKLKGPVLFFLDAHWYRYWPLRDELQAIADTGHKNAVIVVHDFYVPGRKDLGYDQYTPSLTWIDYLWKGGWNRIFEKLFNITVYKRQKLDYPYIKDKVLAINKRYKYYYNKRAVGGKRGVIIIHP
jgi:hypothetical protein